MSNEELFKVLKKNELHSAEMCEVVERYVFDRKGITIKIKVPQDVMRCSLLEQAYNNALAWYVSKYYAEIYK